MRLILSLVVYLTMGQLVAQQEFISKRTIINSGDSETTSIISSYQMRRDNYSDERDQVSWCKSDIDLLRIIPTVDLVSRTDIPSILEITS